MKKIFSSVISLSILLGVLATPTLTGAVSNTSSVQELIATFQQQIADLKAKINALSVQLESLKKAQGEVKEATKEVKETLQLIKQLRRGMTGDDVKLLQEFLATDPDIYPEGLITGYFGPMTERAVKKIQKRMCLDQVGNVGPKTLWKINELLAEGAGQSGKVPPGLLTAPGIQKKLCATTTPDTTVPVISDVVATSTTATSTQIKWTTDELANSKVWYSTSTPVMAATPTSAVSSSDYVLNHTITLSDLTATTTYYYLVTSADKSGNTATTTEKSFTTLGQ